MRANDLQLCHINNTQQTGAIMQLAHKDVFSSTFSLSLILRYY